MLFVILSAIGALVFVLVLYCCLVVASREDDAIEEYFKSIDKAGR